MRRLAGIVAGLRGILAWARVASDPYVCVKMFVPVAASAHRHFITSHSPKTAFFPTRRLWRRAAWLGISAAAPTMSGRSGLPCNSCAHGDVGANAMPRL